VPTATDTRARLLVAARQAFADLGYGRARVEDIVARAGVGHGTFYAYFKNKRAALAALGGRPPHAGAMRVFYLGQLGKYLPGTIWPAVTQMRLGRDYRVPPRAGPRAVSWMAMIARIPVCRSKQNTTCSWPCSAILSKTPTSPSCVPVTRGRGGPAQRHCRVVGGGGSPRRPLTIPPGAVDSRRRAGR
jgi:hypothetical protein